MRAPFQLADTDTMHYETLGRTGLVVSSIGFGAATLGEEYGPVDATTGRRAVDAAIDHGINFFDVSPYYGRTLAEERLGEALRGKRANVILSTKVGRYDRFPPEGFDFSAGRVVRSIEESLRRLRTDVIDLYLAHDIEFGSCEMILGETLPALRKLKEEGKIRAFGITGYPPDLLREVGERGEVDVVLSYCHSNLLNTRMDAVLGPLVRSRGTGLINASPLHMGVLTQEGAPAWHPAPPEVLSAARAAAALCAARGSDLAEVALSFALGRGTAASTLVGMRTETEVLANLRTLEAPADAALLEEVRQLLAPVQDVEWPSGLPENNP
jgi:L-galactose dehydrogenase